MSKVSESFSSFDRENLKGLSKSKLMVGFFSVLLLGGGAVVAASPDVSIGQNGIQINTGSLDVNGNDIKDAGTTIWDASASNIATGVVDYSAATASDVGLGNIENEPQVAESGDLIVGDGNLQFEGSNGGGNIGYFAGMSSGGSTNADSNHLNFHGTVSSDGDSGFKSVKIESTLGDSNSNIGLEAASEVVLKSDAKSNNGGPYECWISHSNGDWNCDGTKSWVHDLGNGSEAYYTSQESPMVRAVYEGQTTVENGKTTVALPSHFEKTVSDTKPILRVQATPHELATVAVTERSDSQLVIEASNDVTVDYRVTGIREGYEDKQVVRPKEEE